MKHTMFLLIIVILLAKGSVYSQNTIVMVPVTMSPNYFTVTVTAAGANPANPMTNYTSQSVKYKWPFLDQGVVGNVSVMSTSIPSGLTMTVLAGGSSGFWNAYGTSTGTITVSDLYQAIISGVWSANNIARPLTQNITISNFAALHPGTYTVTINYRLY